jgi:hypothetical protein
MQNFETVEEETLYSTISEEPFAMEMDWQRWTRRVAS